MVLSKLMTIGQLSQRTEVPIKALREYEQLGLLYTRGRSKSNYRLFDEDALWCVQVIRSLRSLGLTLKDIQELTALYREHSSTSIGAHIGEKLEAVLTRINTRIEELQALKARIHDFKATHSAALAGLAALPLLAADPRCTCEKFSS